MAVMLAATVITAAASAGIKIGNRVSAHKRAKKQMRAIREQYGRQILEEMELAGIREYMRSTQLAEALGSINASTASMGVEGATAGLLLQSAEMQAAIDRQMDALSTGERITTLQAAIRNARMGKQDRVDLALGITGDLVGLGDQAVQVGGEAAANREMAKVKETMTLGSKNVDRLNALHKS